MNPTSSRWDMVRAWVGIRVMPGPDWPDAGLWGHIRIKVAAWLLAGIDLTQERG